LRENDFIGNGPKETVVAMETRLKIVVLGMPEILTESSPLQVAIKLLPASTLAQQ
jgi:hypothetical protein